MPGNDGVQPAIEAFILTWTLKAADLEQFDAQV
jgi:hypothetical protein